MIKMIKMVKLMKLIEISKKKMFQVISDDDELIKVVDLVTS